MEVTQQATGAEVTMRGPWKPATTPDCSKRPAATGRHQPVPRKGQTMKRFTVTQGHRQAAGIILAVALVLADYLYRMGVL